MAARYSASDGFAPATKIRLSTSNKAALDVACAALGVTLNAGVNAAVESWVASPEIQASVHSMSASNMAAYTSVSVNAIAADDSATALIRRLSGASDDDSTTSPGDDAL